MAVAAKSVKLQKSASKNLNPVSNCSLGTKFKIGSSFWRKGTRGKGRSNLDKRHLEIEMGKAKYGQVAHDQCQCSSMTVVGIIWLDVVGSLHASDSASGNNGGGAEVGLGGRG
ncbi:hypothetical protein NL676_011807 [Syzygium grande]|nr:hypothetical protein NL676_011807 [Syzygium grande]